MLDTCIDVSIVCEHGLSSDVTLLFKILLTAAPLGVGLRIRRGVNENVQNIHTFLTHEEESVHSKTHRQSIGRPAPVPNPMSFSFDTFGFSSNCWFSV